MFLKVLLFLITVFTSLPTFVYWWKQQTTSTRMSSEEKSLPITDQEHMAAVTVLIEQGLLQGVHRQTVTGETFYSFKGIPYAAPPIGNFRFRDPQPPASWDGTRDAREHRNICPQVDIITNIFLPGNEDCLYLNVYTPTLTPKSPLVVMFYIHGGGFKSGSGNDDIFGPDFFIAENVVLVTINYRLDALGFISFESAEVPGNAGLKDQVAALKWVKNNIASFGGNPNEVTIFGQSAGGFSCTLHALSPMSKGLFNRSIAMSGTAIHDFGASFEPRRRAFRLGASLGFETENSTELVEFLRSLPAEKLLNTSPTILAQEDVINNIAKMYHFVPVVEKEFGQERFMIEPTDVLIKNRNINEVDLMLGYTNAEALILIDLISTSLINTYKRYPECLVPTKIIRQSIPSVVLKLADSIKDYYFGSESISLKTLAKFITYISDTYVHEIIRYSRALSDVTLNNKIYLYRLSSVSDRNIYGNQGIRFDMSGVGHHDDLFYLFQPYKYNVSINKDSVSYKMIKQMTSLFTNFAKYGNPTPDSSLGVTWSPFNKLNQYFLDIAEDLTLNSSPEASMMKFWKSIYDQAGLPF